MVKYINKFLLFGDSITQQCFDLQDGFNFGAAIASRYTRKMDIIHRGYSGYNTDHAVYAFPAILSEEFSKSSIKLMTVFFGSNDAAIGNEQTVAISKYVENLRNIVETARDKGISVILIGPAVHDEINRPKFIEFNPNNRTTANNLEYSKAAEKLAEELQVPYVDLWHAFAKSVGWNEGDPLPGQIGANAPSVEHLLRDGLHFSGAGYKIMFDEVIKAIDEAYPGYNPENLELMFPEWRTFPESGKIKQWFE